MTRARCRVPDMCVRTLDGFGRRFGLGMVVDLDEVISETGLTLRDALAEHVALFELIDLPPAPPTGLPIEE